VPSRLGAASGQTPAPRADLPTAGGTVVPLGAAAAAPSHRIYRYKSIKIELVLNI
jgi:hypothetical protein